MSEIHEKGLLDEFYLKMLNIKAFPAYFSIYLDTGRIHSSKLKFFLKTNLIKNRLNLNQNQNGSAKRQKLKECILIKLELADLII